MNNGDPHDEIVRLEAQIEALSDKIESCRKFILAGRIAAAAGGVLLVALLLGAIRFDLQLMMFAMAAFLGGIVVWGSKRCHTQQSRKGVGRGGGEPQGVDRHDRSARSRGAADTALRCIVGSRA